MVVPEGVTSIGKRAFNFCVYLTSISLPKGLVSIGAGAFSFCESLVTISFPDGLQEIGSYAFDGCSGLKEIRVPESVRKIGYGAFFWCSSVDYIDVPVAVSFVTLTEDRENRVNYPSFAYIPPVDLAFGKPMTGEVKLYNSRFSSSAMIYFCRS